LQLQQKVEATNFFKESDTSKFVSHGDWIDGVAASQQRAHRVKDVLVTRLIEVLDVNARFRNRVDRFAR
jgi:hypothetical protein